MTAYQKGPKPITRSKTLWTAAATFAASAGIILAEYRWPGCFGENIKSNAEVLLIASLVFGGLRLQTSGPVASK